MTTKLVAALGAAALIMASTAAAAGPSLHGARSLRVLEKVTYRATGLKAASGYTLRITRPASNGGRCAAYLAGPRRAKDTELFHGTLPDGLQCSTRSGRLISRSMTPGAYTAVACVPASAAGGCRASASSASLSVRVVR
jgi:hypothetical protein